MAYLGVYDSELSSRDDELWALIRASRVGTLRYVFMDKVHLHVQHGTSFREDIRALTEQFFRPIFHPKNGHSTVRFVGFTATMPNTYVTELARLTTLKFPPSLIVRASLEEFRNLDITMIQTITNASGFVKLGMTNVVEFLKANEESKVVIFCNSKAKSFHYVSELERKLDEAKMGADLIHIHGDLNKHDKFWRIRLFCGNNDTGIEELNIRGLLTTNAANVGIDDHR